MNEVRVNYKRLFIFGTVSGLLWSLVPGYLSELMYSSVGQTATVLITGVLTGITVSALLTLPLLWLRIKGIITLGIVALPIGAFLFGFFLSLLQKAVQLWIGPTYRFVEYRFAPVEAGLNYAFFSVTYFALILIPLSLLTTSLFYLNVIDE